MKAIYYFEKYVPFVSWTTVILMLILSINQGWATKQVDFSNYLFQATLVEGVCIAFPYYFGFETGEDREKMVTKIKKSLYGMVQAPL